MLFKRLLTVACAGALCAFLLSGCGVRAYVEPVSAPPSPYFQLTAVPSAGEAIDQTVAHMNDAVSQRAAEEAATQAAAEAAAEAAAAEAAAAAAEAPETQGSYDSSYGYDDSYGSGSVGDQIGDICVDPILNF